MWVAITPMRGYRTRHYVSMQILISLTRRCTVQSRLSLCRNDAH